MTTLRAYVRLATKLLLMETLLAQTSTSARSVLTPATRTPIAATLTVASPARAKLALLATARAAQNALEVHSASQVLRIAHRAIEELLFKMSRVSLSVKKWLETAMLFST